MKPALRALVRFILCDFLFLPSREGKAARAAAAGGDGFMGGEGGAGGRCWRGRRAPPATGANYYGLGFMKITRRRIYAVNNLK
jgi:hypothetical protein